VLTEQLPLARMNVSIDGLLDVPTNTYTDLSTQKALSRPSSSLPTSVSEMMKVFDHDEKR
jgi:hypothetical protein